MSALARIRPSLPRRIVREKSSGFWTIPPDNQTFLQFQFSRAIQTSADTTRLQEPPSDPSKPFTVKLHEDSFRTHNCDMPGLDVEVTKDQLMTMYKQMQTMRRMEMAADALYKAKLIRGFCHLAIGQVCNFSFNLMQTISERARPSTGSSVGRSRTWYHKG